MPQKGKKSMLKIIRLAVILGVLLAPVLAFPAGVYIPENYQETPPTAPNDVCEKGKYSFDNTYFYSCIATNTWDRIAWSGWVISRDSMAIAGDQMQIEGEDMQL